MKKVTTPIQVLTSSLKHEPLVSVIIPVYNTPESYLRRCLNSVIGQSYRNLEIIIVDDGSSDNVVEILREYQEADRRIRLLIGSHKGVSAARNLALNNATGDWVAFSDSDDELENNFVTEAVHIGEISNVELVIGWARHIYRGDLISNNPPKFFYYITQSDEERSDLVRQMMSGYSLKKTQTPPFYGRGPHARLYKRSSFLDLLFNEEITISEDVLLNYLFMQKIKNIAMVNRVWYYYYQYSQSTSHNINLKPFIDSLSVLSQYCNTEDDILDFHARALFQVVHCMNNVFTGTSVVQRYRLVKELIDIGKKFNAFDPQIFQIYKVKPWVRVLSHLARHNHTILTVLLWRVFIILKHLLKKRTSI